jgi:hypothetical protein
VEAAINGYGTVVERLLQDQRVNPAVKKNNKDVKRAVRRGHCDVVRLLVRDSRVISFANIDSLARLAYEYGKRRVAKMLWRSFGQQ